MLKKEVGLCKHLGHLIKDRCVQPILLLSKLLSEQEFLRFLICFVLMECMWEWCLS